MHSCCTHSVVKRDACQKYESTVNTRYCQQYCQCISAVKETLIPGLVTGAYTALEGVRLMKEYLDLAEQYPTPMRMIRGHTFSLIGQYCCLLSTLCFLSPGVQASSHVSCTSFFRLFAVSVWSIWKLTDGTLLSVHDDLAWQHAVGGNMQLET